MIVIKIQKQLSIQLQDQSIIWQIEIIEVYILKEKILWVDYRT